MKKKNKTNVAGWATVQFFLSLSHNTACCIVIGKSRRQRDVQRGGHDTARPRPRHGVVGPQYFRARARHGAQCARLGAGSRYNNCIVAERGATLCLDTVQPEAAIWSSTPCDTAQGRCDMHDSARQGARA